MDLFVGESMSPVTRDQVHRTTIASERHAIAISLVTLDETTARSPPSVSGRSPRRPADLVGRASLSDVAGATPYDHHVLVADTFRLVLFTQPKVASSELIKLVRRIAGFRDWRDDPHHLDRPLLSDRAPATIDGILTHPDWTVAAVLRDPAERLLSAYLDKYRGVPSHVSHALRPDGFGMPFEEFLGYVLDPNDDPTEPAGLHLGTEPHWRPQALVGGLAAHRDRLTDVGDFADVAGWTRRLLTRVGAWERFGAWGWGPDGDQAIFDGNDSIRRTGAAALIEEFYDPITLEAVYDAYAIDLELGRSFGLDLRHHRPRTEADTPGRGEVR